MNRFTLLYTKQMNNMDLLYSTQNYIQHLVITYNRISKHIHTHTYRAQSLRYTPESNTTSVNHIRAALSHSRPILWTVAHQAPPSMGFSRQEYWRGLPFPSPGDFLDPGIEPGSPALEADSCIAGRFFID